MACINSFVHQQGILCFDHRVHLCVLYESQNRQRLFRYAALPDRLLLPKWSVFFARYELNLYIELRLIFVS
jgi:hypothetical protein